MSRHIELRSYNKIVFNYKNGLSFETYPENYITLEYHSGDINIIKSVKYKLSEYYTEQFEGITTDVHKRLEYTIDVEDSGLASISFMLFGEIKDTIYFS